MSGVPAARRWGDEGPASVAILMLSALGDAVHVLPVANALKRAWPRTRITWIIQPVPHRLVAGHPAIDEFILFGRRRGVAALGSFAQARAALGERRFDLLLALQVYFKAGLLAALARADVKLGFDRARARDANWLFTSERIAPAPVQHVQDQYFEFLLHLGLDAEPVEWKIPVREPERARQRDFLDSLDRPAVALVVGTSKPQKNWNPERYAALAEVLEGDLGLRPVLVGGPSAIEREAADRILGLTRARVVDALGDGIDRLVALLAASPLVVSPDTGPLHIARALETPVVGLYGYTNPKRYGPYRRYGELIVDGYARHPGEEYGPSMEHRAGGMQRITVEMVVEKVEAALQGQGQGQGQGRGRERG